MNCDVMLEIKYRKLQKTLLQLGNGPLCYRCGRCKSEGHLPNCIVDKALTESGLPDVASRDSQCKEYGL